MQRENINGADIEYLVQGEGEPLLFIHGNCIADAFFPLLAESRLAGSYRIILYHRRGYCGSARACEPFDTSQQAADGQALLRHLGIARAHIVGHSYGAAIALQWALDAPDQVHSLAVLEPPLIKWVPSGKAFWEFIAFFNEMYKRGEREGMVDVYLTGLVGPEYRRLLNTAPPPGAFEQVVADLDTFFQIELPELQRWQFTAEDARRIRQPVLAVVGGETAPFHIEGHELLKQWVRHAEELVAPLTNHALQII
ncbi:MAG: alpha/beta hydrolase, partial [Dissulfurispiraceae bacterium]